eukprot:GEMP01023542.1.p1 GENE.GEMP01023542.1~~GEMP01023542.1.p1  ORF type:complete len:592 (+),score=140.99 GEMP01023542.1:106-1881(+)
MPSLISSLVSTMFSDAASKLEERNSSAFADAPSNLNKSCDYTGFASTAPHQEKAQDNVLTLIPAVHLPDSRPASADSDHYLKSSSSSSSWIAQRKGKLCHPILRNGTSVGIPEAEKRPIYRPSSSSSGGTTVEARFPSDSDTYNGVATSPGAGRCAPEEQVGVRRQNATVAISQGNPAALPRSAQKTPMNVERFTKTLTTPAGEATEAMLESAPFGISFGAMIGNLAQRLQKNAETNAATPREDDARAVVPSSSHSCVPPSINMQSNAPTPTRAKTPIAARIAESAAAVASSAYPTTTVPSAFPAVASATSSSNPGTEPMREQNISTHSPDLVGHNGCSDTAENRRPYTATNQRPDSAGSPRRLGMAVSRMRRSYGQLRPQNNEHESAVGTTRPMQNFTCPPGMNLESPLMNMQAPPCSLDPRAASLRSHQSWTHFLPLKRGVASQQQGVLNTSARTLSASTSASTSTLSTATSTAMPPSKPDLPTITIKDTLPQASTILMRPPIKQVSRVTHAAAQRRANARHATAQRAILQRNTTLRGTASTVSPHMESYGDDSAIREALMASPESTCSSAIRKSVGMAEEFSAPPRQW